MSLNIPNNVKTAAWESVKEFVRTGLLGNIVTTIPLIVAGINTSNGEFGINWGIVTAVFSVNVLTALARAIDRFVHEWNGTKLKGVIPF